MGRSNGVDRAPYLLYPNPYTPIFMPITKSAKKAIRQTKRRTARNLRRKAAYKKALKQIQKLIAAKRLEEAASLVPQAYKALDKAAKTGVLEPNAAARRKSQVTTWIRKIKTAA